jgi:hypothetical protein
MKGLTTMVAQRSEPDPRQAAEVCLAETYRKLTRIHASLASSDRDPSELRNWAIDQLAEAIDEIEPVVGTARVS